MSPRGPITSKIMSIIKVQWIEPIRSFANVMTPSIAHFSIVTDLQSTCLELLQGHIHNLMPIRPIQILISLPICILQSTIPVRNHHLLSAIFLCWRIPFGLSSGQSITSSPKFALLPMTALASSPHPSSPPSPQFRPDYVRELPAWYNIE